MAARSSIDYQDPFERLRYACEYGSLQAFQQGLAADGEKIAINKRDEKQRSLYHIAVLCVVDPAKTPSMRENALEIIRALFLERANWKEVDAQGRTPLFCLYEGLDKLGASTYIVKCMALFLEHAKKEGKEACAAFINRTDRENQTVLARAIDSGITLLRDQDRILDTQLVFSRIIETIQLLCDAEADPNLPFGGKMDFKENSILRVVTHRPEEIFALKKGWKSEKWGELYQILNKASDLKRNAPAGCCVIL